jgi:5-formyltetrahydrofolate cyclo-ligase
MAQPSAQLNAERRRLRELRRSLPESFRKQAARDIARRLGQLGVLKPGRRVAVYVAVRGEVSLDRVIRRGWRTGVHLYTPRVLNLRRRSMAFLPLHPRGDFERSGYGLYEPPYSARARMSVSRLDFVLMPVLGFDRTGHRLGMGAGFYDQAFRHRVDMHRAWRRPRLIGIAYACQEVPKIMSSTWDVALDLIVTEQGVIRPPRFT